MLEGAKGGVDEFGAVERRILVLSFLEPWSIGPGQGAPSLYETLAGYARAGWAVDYITFHKRALLGGAHERSVSVDIPGVTEHRFSMPYWSWVPANLHAKLDRLILFPILALPATLRLLRQRSPSVFYAYEASAILAAGLSRLFRRKRELRVHRVQGVSVLGTSHRSFPFMIRKLESLLSLKALADAYIMTDDGTSGDEVWRHWNASVKGDRLLHIRNGISPELLAPPVGRDIALKDIGLDPAHSHILMLSRLDPIKRVDRGLRAVATLADRHPHIRLLIVGDGEQRAELESMAFALGIRDRVCFLGALNRRGVANVFQCSDIFLSLYDFSNCGNPLFEALLFHLPVITLDNGATGSVIQHGENGFLLPVDDGRALNDALETLLTDANARERLHFGAKVWARANLMSWAARMDMEIDWVSGKIQC